MPARVREMPTYVDHHARRLQVTEVAAEIVAARGVEALTVRAVAAATGFSTAVVSHYFLDKRDLLRSTFRAAANRSTSRFESAASSAVFWHCFLSMTTRAAIGGYSSPSGALRRATSSWPSSSATACAVPAA